MKKETIITAVVFLGIGFLAGYTYNAQKNAGTSAVEPASASGIAQDASGSSNSAGTATEGAGAENRSPTGSPAGLPPGHPPLDAATTVKFLENEAAKNPRDSKPRLELANYLYDQKRFQEAVVWYQKALAIDPKNVSARTDLGTSFLSLGRPQDAVREYRKSLQLDPAHQPTMFNLIIANLEGIHDLAAAQAAWEKLHRLNPNYPGLDQLRQSLSASK